jgi:hypothetical protein
VQNNEDCRDDGHESSLLLLHRAKGDSSLNGRRGRLRSLVFL